MTAEKLLDIIDCVQLRLYIFATLRVSGQKFAMLELKALVGNLLHKFYLEPIDLSSEVRLMSDLVIRPVTPIRIKLIRRS